MPMKKSPTITVQSHMSKSFKCIHNHGVDVKHNFGLKLEDVD